MDDVKGWFSSAADKIANFQEPMNNLVNNTQSTPPAITGDMVNSNVNRPGFPGECFICELRLPDHRF